MRLSELSPKFLRRDDNRHFHHVDTLGEADGIQFLCPKCFAVNGGPAGTHGVICWSPQVPQDTQPTPGRWRLVGTSVEDLTLVGEKSSSVALGGGCAAHFLVENGEIKDC